MERSPRWLRFSVIIRVHCLSLSTKTACLAPRLKASIPRFPLPAKRSSTVIPFRRPIRILNIDSLTLSEVGLTLRPGGIRNRLPFAIPPITRTEPVPTSVNPFPWPGGGQNTATFLATIECKRMQPFISQSVSPSVSSPPAGKPVLVLLPPPEVLLHNGVLFRCIDIKGRTSVIGQNRAKLSP